MKLVTPLTLSVTPRLLQFSAFWSACFLCPWASSHSELRYSPHAEKRKTDQSHLFQSLQGPPVQQRIQYKINTLCYKCITGTAPSYLFDRLQHTLPYSSYALLLILSASRFLVPDFPLLFSAPILSSVPLHGMTQTPSTGLRHPSLEEGAGNIARSVGMTVLFQDSLKSNLKTFFPGMFYVPCCCLPPPRICVCCPF